MVSAADRGVQRGLNPQSGLTGRAVSAYTLSVAAGLGESLAVCEQSDPRHRDSQHAAVLTGFILRGKEQTDGWNQ